MPKNPLSSPDITVSGTTSSPGAKLTPETKHRKTSSRREGQHQGGFVRRGDRGKAGAFQVTPA